MMVRRLWSEVGHADHGEPQALASLAGKVHVADVGLIVGRATKFTCSPPTSTGLLTPPCGSCKARQSAAPFKRLPNINIFELPLFETASNTGRGKPGVL